MSTGAGAAGPTEAAGAAALRPVTAADPPSVRRMTADDSPAVTAIFEESFPGKIAAASPRDPALAARLFTRVALASGDAWVHDAGEVAGVLTLQDRHVPWHHHCERRLLRDVRPASARLRLMTFFALFHAVDFPADELYLETMGVRTALRGHGIGGELLTFAEQEARRRGRTSVSLYCVRENAAARALYVRRGYRIVLSEDLWWAAPILGLRITDMFRLRLA